MRTIASITVCLAILALPIQAQNIVGNPSAGQAITQPSGTTIAINSLNSTSLNADLFPGSDVGAKIAAADAALGSAPGTISVNTGGMISTAVTLSSGHNLRLNAPVSVSAAITLSGMNSVSCSGPGATITSAVGGGNAVFSGATSATNVSLADCTFAGTVGTYMFSTSTSVSNFTMRNNVGNSTSLFIQTGVSGGGSSNILIEGNSSIYTQGESGTVASVLLYGKFQHVRIANNYFEGGGNGVQLYAADGSGQPNLSQIIAFGGVDSVVTGNTCKNINTCSWGSGVYKMVMSSNVADVCHDVCFDGEGSANVEMVGNTAEGASSGDFSFFYSGYNNSVIGNNGVSDGAPIVLVRNSGQQVQVHQNLKVQGNQFFCNTSSPCAFLSLDSNSFTDVEDNTVRDGILAAGGYSNSLSIRNNHFIFDMATNAGLSIPTSLNGTTDTIEGNEIDTTYFGQASSSACMAQTQIDYNNYDVFYFTRNHCIGGWGTSFSLAANGGNGGIGVIWIADGNTLPTLSITPGGSNPNRTLYQLNNCIAGTTICDNTPFTHPISTGPAPSVAVLSGAGPGASVSLSNNSTDSSGFVTLNFGSSGYSSGSPIFQLTFGTQWGAAPKCYLSPASYNTASVIDSAYIAPSAITASGFQATLAVAPYTSSVANNVWAYKCEQ